MSVFVKMVRAQHPKARLVLLGFSSGGGFALHMAATPLGASFERAVLLSPMLGPRAPTAAPWVAVYLPRIIALVILNRIGVHVFDGLPVLAFAVEPTNPAKLTTNYSFRLMEAFGTKDYAADIRNARCPLAVLVASGLAVRCQTLRPDRARRSPRGAGNGRRQSQSHWPDHRRARAARDRGGDPRAVTSTFALGETVNVRPSSGCPFTQVTDFSAVGHCHRQARMPYLGS